MLFQFLTAFSSILLLLSGVFLHHLPSLNTFCFNFCACKLHRFLDSKVLINLLFRKILTIVHLNSKLWNQLVPIPSSCGSSGVVRFSSRGVRLFPALLERGVRPSYGTFFHMVFQGNCARVRTGHMIILFTAILLNI